MPGFEHQPSDVINHPLYAVIDGEAVSLDGHQEKGVISVLNIALRDRKLELADVAPVQLVNNPEDVNS